jgi:predicted nucleic-acid-binding Zn-ribbon protein
MTNQPITDTGLLACPKCGGERVAAHLSNTTIVANDASGGIFVKGSTAGLAVCLICGYSELYATIPQALKPKVLPA